jgi:hypothetical protein
MDKSLDSARNALALRATLARESPEAPGALFDLATSQGNLSGLLFLLNQHAAAIQSNGDGCASLAKLVQAYPSAHEYSAQLVRTYVNRSTMLESDGKLIEAIAALEKGREIQDAVVTAHADDAAQRGHLIEVLSALGKLRGHGPLPASAFEPFEAARRSAQILADAEPSAHE